MSSKTRPRVGLFVTCLVDLVRPSVGFAAARLIEASGCALVVPQAQTCCGQPAYNSGYRRDARQLALNTMRAFEGCDYVVAPSGSCAAMLKVHYPRLFVGDGVLYAEANAFAGRVFELTSFLADVRRMARVETRLNANATYHDSCSGLRELGIKSAPRRLLSSVEGLELTECKAAESCCGFGGLFSVKFPDISNAMAESKLGSCEESGADLVLAGDLGCLMHLAGTCSRGGRRLQFRHVAEVLAGELSSPAIAKPDDAP